jgi:CheY-like chemotaxis protein
VYPLAIRVRFSPAAVCCRYDLMDADDHGPHLDGHASVAGHPDLLGVRVLIVEDERESRAVLTAMLSLVNATVFAVERAREALAVLRTQRFDLLISDIGLKGRSGYEFLRAVRALPIAPDSLPAIAVTGHATSIDRSQAIDAGFQAHVAKPVDMQVLFLTVRALLATRSSSTDRETLRPPTAEEPESASSLPDRKQPPLPSTG